MKSTKRSAKPDPYQYDLEEAIARSLDGQSAAMYSEDALWRDKYKAHAERFLSELASGAEFIGEDINRYVIERIGAPGSPNSLGALVNTMVRRWVADEAVIRTQRLRQMTKKTSHARSSRIYEKR